MHTRRRHIDFFQLYYLYNSIQCNLMVFESFDASLDPVLEHLALFSFYFNWRIWRIFSQLEYNRSVINRNLRRGATCVYFVYIYMCV